MDNDRETERIKTGKRWIETTLHRRAQEHGLQLGNFAWKAPENDSHLFNHLLYRLSFSMVLSGDRHAVDFSIRQVSDCAHDDEVQCTIIDTRLDPLITSLMQKS